MLRSVTRCPVFGALRCGLSAAIARAERFGLIGFVNASIVRQQRVLQAMGLESRLIASIPLNLTMDQLIDPAASRARLAKVGKTLRAQGAEAIVLGCAGMAGHRGFVEDAAGVPVIEPCQAAAMQAILAVLERKGRCPEEC